jgi:hypothetical protein
MAPGIYLAFGQWRASGRLVSRLPYLLGASVMGAGIMLTVVSAIVGVLYGRRVAFERTPKYGITQTSDTWDGKRYASGLDALLAGEILVAGFSLGSVAYAALVHNWASFFYTAYFMAGLLFIIALSFVQTSFQMLPHTLASSPSGNRES